MYEGGGSMSMTLFLIGQLVGMFCAYFGVTILIPMVVFRRFLKHRTITNQIFLIVDKKYTVFFNTFISWFDCFNNNS
mgnify:CR=1 FL=1